MHHVYLDGLEEALVDYPLNVGVGERQDVVEALVPGLGEKQTM